MAEPRYVVGIDPGKTGGVALLEDGRLLAAMRMPMLSFGSRQLVDTPRIGELITSHRPVDHRRAGFRDGFHVVIEAVHSMPRQGVASMFTFGRHAGAVESWALQTGQPLSFVTPSRWKKHFGLSSNKRASLDMARVRFGPLTFPGGRAQRSTADATAWNVLANEGIAEAALIALWWRETHP